jgi:hypothetical protein
MDGWMDGASLCLHGTAVDHRLANVEHMWFDIDGKIEGVLSKTDCRGNERGPSCRELGDEPPELWQGY